MGILTEVAIRRFIQEGRVIVEPLFDSQIGPASIDLHLGDQFRVFIGHSIFEIEETADLSSATKLVVLQPGEVFTLLPGCSCQGITQERIALPDDICGWLVGRSRFARPGLVINCTASFVHPGIDNKQVLEITNFGPLTLLLRPGAAVCQLILEECQGTAKYQGRFRHQSSP